MPVEGK